MSRLCRRRSILALLLGLLFVSGATAADGTLEFTVVDKTTGRPIACRMHLRIGKEDGRARKIPDLPFWHDHVTFAGRVTLELPRGQYFFTLEHGPEYTWNTGHFVIKPRSFGTQTAELLRGVDMASHGWYAADMDVRRPFSDLLLLMQAEEIHLAQIVAWDAERGKLVKNLPLEKTLTLGDSFAVQMTAGQIRHPGGTLTVHGLDEPPKLPRQDGDYPALSEITAVVRQQPDAWIDLAHPASWDLPLLMAHDAVDSVRVVHDQFQRDQVIETPPSLKPRDKMLYPGGDGVGRWSQDIYFKLLDSGHRLPPTAASLSGEAPNPLGYNRTYVFLDQPFSPDAWWQGLRAGRVVVGNGPLLQPWVEGHRPGHVFESLDGAPLTIEPVLSLSYRGHEPLRYLELIRDGQVKYSLNLEEYIERQGKLPPLKFSESGWFLMRAVSEIQSTYRFAMTAPYYVEIGEDRRVSRAAAQFFLDWTYQRARGINVADSAKREQVIAAHRKARDYWQNLVDTATAE